MTKFPFSTTKTCFIVTWNFGINDSTKTGLFRKVAKKFGSLRHRARWSVAPGTRATGSNNGAPGDAAPGPTSTRKL